MMLNWDILQVWLIAVFTLFIYTFPFKENPLYRFAEHVFIGSAAGFGVVMAVKNINDYAWTPMVTKAEWTWIIPMILGIVLYARFSAKYYWLSRYGVGVLVAIATALSMRTIVEAQFLSQIRGTFLNPITMDPKLIVGGAWRVPILNNLLIIVIVVTVVIYFIFTGGTKIQTTRSVSAARTVGRYAMMVAFGATFGNTIMTRVAFLIGRIRAITVGEALPALPFIFLLIALAMIPREYYERAGILKKK